LRLSILVVVGGNRVPTSFPVGHPHQHVGVFAFGDNDGGAAGGSQPGCLDLGRHAPDSFLAAAAGNALDLSVDLVHTGG